MTVRRHQKRCPSSCWSGLEWFAPACDTFSTSRLWSQRFSPRSSFPQRNPRYSDSKSGLHASSQDLESRVRAEPRGSLKFQAYFLGYVNILQPADMQCPCVPSSLLVVHFQCHQLVLQPSLRHARRKAKLRTEPKPEPRELFQAEGARCEQLCSTCTYLSGDQDPSSQVGTFRNP